MKHETKMKIIRWVKKLLKYDECKYQRFISIETRKVQIMISQRMISDHDLEIMSEEQERFASNRYLIDELESRGFIKHSRQSVSGCAFTLVKSELKVILP